jgi:hypothetical protein
MSGQDTARAGLHPRALRLVMSEMDIHRLNQLILDVAGIARPRSDSHLALSVAEIDLTRSN